VCFVESLSELHMMFGWAERLFSCQCSEVFYKLILVLSQTFWNISLSLSNITELFYIEVCVYWRSYPSEVLFKNGGIAFFLIFILDLADTFIQTDLQCISRYTFTFLSVLTFPWNRTHDLGVASTNALLF